MRNKYTWGISWVLLLHAASTLGQQQKSSRSPMTEVYTYSSIKGLEPVRRIRATVSTPHASTSHGIHLQYTLDLYINTTAATPTVVQLTDANITGTQGLIQNFGNSLVTALGQTIAALFPPGMKSIQVNKLQPGKPVKADVVMYVNMNAKPDGVSLGPCTVLEDTNNWFGKGLITPRSGSQSPIPSQLDPVFVSRYALQTVSVTPSIDSDGHPFNADDIHNCNYVASYSGSVPVYAYIVGAVFGSLVVACVVYRVCRARDTCTAQAADDSSNGHAPTTTVRTVAMRAVSDNMSDAGTPYSWYVLEQTCSAASYNASSSAYLSNKDVSNSTGTAYESDSHYTLDVYAEPSVYEISDASYLGSFTTR